MPHVVIEGVRLRYESYGEEGSPVLLVMGLSFPGQVWEPQAEALSARHRVAWFDNRGVGMSDAPPGTYSIRRMADDGIAIADHLGWGRMHVAGVSMGGMIAQEIALSHRDRVRSLTLIATHAGGAPPPSPALSGHRWLLQSHLFSGRKRIRALARVLFPRDWIKRQDPEELHRELLRLLGARDRLSSTRSQLSGLMRFDARKRLGQLAGLPTLILQPGRDIIIKPKESERLARLIPGSELVRFPEAGHGVIHQCAEEVNGRLLSHFEAADALD